jgi:hypothetical protein
VSGEITPSREAGLRSYRGREGAGLARARGVKEAKKQTALLDEQNRLAMLQAELLIEAQEKRFPCGYYADPQGQADLRLWDGEKWTEYTATQDRGGPRC